MEDKQENYNRVIAYIRKSSEDNEKGQANKQLNSLDYQKNFVNEAITRYNLKLLRQPFEDDKTGYEAFVRDGSNGFNAMLEYLREHKNEVDGIVCTEISRLARNFADGGMILWYMQSGIIKRIYTPSKVFTNSSSDQLMVAIEFAMSKKSSDDTGYRTKEGMRSKVTRFKHPARPAILGYRTEGPRGEKKWVIDEKIGPKVVMVFKQFATGKFTFEQIADYAFSIGITSKHSKDGKYGKNTWQSRLRDSQYTGIFEHDGERIVGEYERLVDPELFYQVQQVLENHQHPKTLHMEYAYSDKLIKCGLCGGFLSGTHKKGITYYRCGKKKSPCREMSHWPYVTEKQVEDYIMPAFENIEIDEETWKEAREYVAEVNQPEKLELKNQIRVLNEKVAYEEKMQNGFGRRSTIGEIDQIQYRRLMEDSKMKVNTYRSTIVKCENIAYELDELMQKFLENIKHVAKKLKTALPANKREMIEVFCENFIWNDNKLRWDWKKPYFFIAKNPKKSAVLPGEDSNL